MKHREKEVDISHSIGFLTFHLLPDQPTTWQVGDMK